MRAAKEWGMSPTTWGKEPRWSRAVMVAQTETDAKIDFWMLEDSRRK